MSHYGSSFRSWREVCCLSIAWLMALSSMAAPGVAGEKSNPEDLVREALHQEIYGLQSARQELLERAADLDATNPAARWHQGQVRLQRRWVPVDKIAEQLADYRLLERYEAERSAAAKDVPGHLKMAAWCRAQGLADQERAHLFQVLDLAPNHAAVRGRLGFVQVDGRWVTREEIAEAEADAAAQTRNLREWQPRVNQLRRQLGQRSEKKREAAAQQIESIQDAAAIPAMEDGLTGVSEEAATFVLSALRKMPEVEASVAMARLAVFSPFDAVRNQAATALAERPLDHFVPVMLASMYTPVETYLEVNTDANGRLIYRHRFLREGQDERQLLDAETEYERVGMRGGDRRATAARALRDAARRIQVREAGVLQQNIRTQMLNDRLAEALRAGTGQSYGAVPQDWWAWWNEHRDIYESGDKPLRTIRDYDEVYVADSAPTSSGGGRSGGTTGGGGSHECLAAGTPVWTQRGAVAIETIEAGDMVLAQDVESGELALKAVVRTTTRPEGMVVRIVAEDCEIKASGGHLFWVAGEGWRTAKEITSGMLLHTPSGSVRVGYTEELEPEVTYNLIVDGFHTYFAGDQKILCHDNAPPRITDHIVPGLAQD